MDRLAQKVAHRWISSKDKTEGEYSAGHLYFCPDDNTVLLTKRSGIMHHPYQWDIPGGRNDYDDESVEATATREAEEELHKLPKDASLLGKHIETWSKKSNPEYHYHIFLYAVPESEKIRWTPKIQLDEENLGFKWFKLDELPSEKLLHFDLSWVPEAAKKGLESVEKTANIRTASVRTASSMRVAASLETLKPRYEHKYWISLASADAIRDFIREHVTADEHGLNYTIHNIYLDNPELEFFADHVQRRKAAHMKLRARTYAGDQVFLEVKQKAKGICSKSRSIVPASVYGTVLRTASQVSDRIPFLKIALEHHSGPIVRLDYDREAYNAFEASGRVTIDTNVRYSRHQSFAFSGEPRNKLLPPDVGILELKFSGEEPAFMKELRKAFSLKRASISKYCMTVANMLKKNELLVRQSMREVAEAGNDSR